MNITFELLKDLPIISTFFHELIVSLKHQPNISRRRYIRSLTRSVGSQVTPLPPFGPVGLEVSHCAQPHQCGLQIPAEHDLPWKQGNCLWGKKKKGKCHARRGCFFVRYTDFSIHFIGEHESTGIKWPNRKTICIDIITPAPTQMPDPSHATEIHTMRLCRASTWHSSKNCCSSLTCWACCTCKASEPSCAVHQQRDDWNSHLFKTPWVFW